MPPYSAMFLLNTNTGLLSDDPWFPNQNLTVDERLSICSKVTSKPLYRQHILHWLNSNDLRALYVNQRTFQSHWKIHVLPIGIGPSHYQILLNRFGVENIFDFLKEAASVPGALLESRNSLICRCIVLAGRERPNLLGVNHSWCCGRSSPLFYNPCAFLNFYLVLQSECIFANSFHHFQFRTKSDI